MQSTREIAGVKVQFVTLPDKWGKPSVEVYRHDGRRFHYFSRFKTVRQAVANISLAIRTEKGL